VYQVQETPAFRDWLSAVRDQRAKARILARLVSLRLGNLGDCKSVGGGVSELRVDVGPGYRIYFRRRRSVVIELLCGGDKSTQSKDIARAQAMARESEQE
jgi:putative addiction module killer protein